MVSPALRGPAGLAVLVTDTLEQLTVIVVTQVPACELELGLELWGVLLWSWLETVPQVWVSVPDWMWMLKLPVVAARRSEERRGGKGGRAWLMEHDEMVGLTDQSMPLPVGRLSVRTTPWATPAPVLATAMS